MNKNVLLLCAIFFLLGGVAGFSSSKLSFVTKYLSANQVKDKFTKFLSDQKSPYTVDSALEKETYLYELQLKSGDQKFPIIVSKDGKYAFQGVIELDKKVEEEKPAEIKKSSKPVVELFVMSHCPYGTQAEKGILPVWDILKDKIDFSIKFVDYAMHGKTELDEQLRQYCINKEFSNQYPSYLKCFLENGKSDTCMNGIDSQKLALCISETDTAYKITANFEAKAGYKGDYPSFDIYKEENNKYGVQGSPTLVINGVVAGSNRDPKSLLATVCSAFETQPEECKNELSSETPAPGFGSGTTQNSTDASCN